jgi:hypothetical protein
VAAAGASPPGADAPRIRSRIGQARLAVAADVVTVTPFDDGRVVVARLRVREAFRGEAVAGSELDVVEMRDLPSTPALFVGGEHVIAFLVPAPRRSYLARTLPAGRYFESIAGRAGRLVAHTPHEATVLADLVRRTAAAAREPERDPDRRAALTRRLVFDSIASGHPELVEDGAAGLGEIADLAAALTADEQRRIEGALTERQLPPRTRARVARAAGVAGLRQLVPALRILAAPDPEVLLAAWEALVALGEPPSIGDLRPHLRAGDAGMRVAAVRGALRARAAEAIPLVTPLVLQDPDASVRREAIEALGASQMPEALPLLRRVFADPAVEIRQAAAQSIVRIGGRPAAETLAALAFEAPADAQRYAVVLLLALGVERDDVLVDHIRRTHPDDSVRRLIEHGLDVPHL